MASRMRGGGEIWDDREADSDSGRVKEEEEGGGFACNHIF